jgi:hypothetical protein
VCDENIFLKIFFWVSLAVCARVSVTCDRLAIYIYMMVDDEYKIFFCVGIIFFVCDENIFFCVMKIFFVCDENIFCV